MASRGGTGLPQLLGDVGVGLVVEHSGKVVLVNDAFCRLSGYAAAELLALQTVSSVFAPQDREVLAKGSAQRASGADEPRTLRVAIVRPDGGRVPVAVRAHLVVSDRRPEMVATFRDLSEVDQVAAEPPAAPTSKRSWPSWAARRSSIGTSRRS